MRWNVAPDGSATIGTLALRLSSERSGTLFILASTHNRAYGGGAVTAFNINVSIHESKFMNDQAGGEALLSEKLGMTSINGIVFESNHVTSAKSSEIVSLSMHAYSSVALLCCMSPVTLGCIVSLIARIRQQDKIHSSENKQKRLYKTTGSPYRFSLSFLAKSDSKATRRIFTDGCSNISRRPHY